MKSVKIVYHECNTMQFGFIIERIVDLLFPPSEAVRDAETKTAEDLYREIPRARDLPHAALRALFDYHHPLMRTLIWELKYRGNRKIARLLASALYDSLIEDGADLLVFSNFKQPLIIPVPLSTKRFRERGFNQINLIIEELKKLDRSHTFMFPNNIVRKIKHTETQTSIKNKKHRTENIAGCFEVANPVSIQGRNIIILDDVVTTGSTMEEIRKTLLSAGARKVVGIALAH